MARPSKYKPELHAFVIEYMARCGMTDKQMADELGIVESTLHKWKLDHPEFSESIKKGKKEPDEKVVSALFLSAIGHMAEESEVELDANGTIIKTKVKQRYIPPNVTAQIYWSNNRMPEQWSNRQYHAVDPENNEIKVTVEIIDK